MHKRSLKWFIVLLCAWVLILVSQPILVFCGSIPQTGTNLSGLQFEAPVTEEERNYLGIGTVETLSIDELNCELLMIEIVGVYCPQCHVQMPYFNKLFYRIKRDADINKKAKMLAIAVGANPMELAYFKKKYNIPYPVIKDPDFEIHKLLGEPRTPFIMLITRDRKVVFAHMGIIKDIDTFFMQIKTLIQCEKAP